MVYPKYYPTEVVGFFCELHNEDAVLKDIESGRLYVLKKGEAVIGTGSFDDCHITRVYVLPEFQKMGFGTFELNKLLRI